MHLGLDVKQFPRKIRHLKVCGYITTYDGLFCVSMIDKAYCNTYTVIQGR